MRKRTGIALGAAVLLAAVLSSCSSGEKDRTADEWTHLYQETINAHGGEMVEYNPVITELDPEDSTATLVMESLGLAGEDLEAFGVSASVMNTQAYTLAAIQPVSGHEEAVREALQNYVDRQRSNFEFYLPDQYQIAQEARLETLEDGTVLLVMCQDGDAVFEAIRKDLESAQ